MNYNQLKMENSAGPLMGGMSFVKSVMGLFFGIWLLDFIKKQATKDNQAKMAPTASKNKISTPSI
ncbi:MAG: hypothetical protein PHE27_07135 [Alphaproteobacteria bacterium]|nr:hypothetical protein [Alphaproteobacteria bacterium]